MSRRGSNDDSEAPLEKDSAPGIERVEGLLYAVLLAVVGGTATVAGGNTFAPAGDLLLLAALGYGTLVFFGPFGAVGPVDEVEATEGPSGD